MKIDLAVWTAVDGYDWQPGNVYSPKELASYKDAIGPLEQYSLPLGGLFLKDGRAVFYRVQIADRMDSRGRGAIYLVLGTVAESRVSEVDFAEIFNSPELAQPQKPFPTAIEHDAKPRKYRSPLGRAGFAERRFTGSETFAELGGWCAEAKEGRLNVRITGTMESPLFTVEYAPGAKSSPEPAWRRDPYYPKPEPKASGTAFPPQLPRNPYEEELKRPGGLNVSSFVLGLVLGILLAALVFLADALFGGKGEEDQPERDETPKKESRIANPSGLRKTPDAIDDKMIDDKK